ncbi:hypothetical protein GTR02_11390 [Kineococcus sp. R8]|uniref:hypothetical protein n=1 Tax=Kineococcus siccus TaxID=2696567 RepID=UPI00141323FC|nr:hypothetical protein [Kineococcus siccus]NAZ82424.1 hypothetical protein [Kineococcus siccus]
MQRSRVARRPGRGVDDDARLPLRLLLGQAVTGVVLGVVWWALTRSPGPLLVGEPVVTTSLAYPVARDGTLAVLGLALGAGVGVLVLRRARRQPLLLLAGAVCGALAGSLLAAGTGAALPPSDPADPLHVSVTAWGVLLLWPLAVCVVVLVVTLASAVVDWVREPRAEPGKGTPGA